MLSAKELRNQFELRQDLGQHTNFDKDNHLGFFKTIVREMLTERKSHLGLATVKLLAKTVTKRTGIPIIFHDKFAAAKFYCKTFDETFVNERHGSHIELLQSIKKKMNELRASNCDAPFAMHIFTQIKHLFTKNNLKLSMVIKHKTLLPSEKTIELHCLTQAMLMPMKKIHGQIGFGIDPNGTIMQNYASMCSL